MNDDDEDMDEFSTSDFEFPPKNASYWKRRAKKLEQTIDALLRELHNANTGLSRYEVVRKMNPQEFSELYKQNISTGVSFDVLVDAMRDDVSISE